MKPTLAFAAEAHSPAQPCMRCTQPASPWSISEIAASSARVLNCFWSLFSSLKLSYNTNVLVIFSADSSLPLEIFLSLLICYCIGVSKATGLWLQWEGTAALFCFLSKGKKTCCFFFPSSCVVRYENSEQNVDKVYIAIYIFILSLHCSGPLAEVNLEPNELILIIISYSLTVLNIPSRGVSESLHGA